MKFTPSDLIEIPIIKGTTIDLENIKNPDWWAKFDTKIKNNAGHEKILPFKDGIGCYIFSIKKQRNSNIITPWYVGKTETQNFEKECFSDHKFKKYTEILIKERGMPMLTLIAKLKEQHLGLSIQSSGISELEEMLIRRCVGQNKNLSNIITASLAKKLQVEGFTVPYLYGSKKGRRENRIINFSKLIG